MLGSVEKKLSALLESQFFEASPGHVQWYHFGVGAPPIFVYSSGDGDVRWGYGVMTHSTILDVGPGWG